MNMNQLSLNVFQYNSFALYFYKTKILLRNGNKFYYLAIDQRESHAEAGLLNSVSINCVP